MKKTQGFTLLEVLTSLFLLSLLILGIAALQVAVLRESRGAYYFHQALLLAENMCEHLAANDGHAVPYELVWREQLKIVLPKASAQVSGRQSRVAIEWGGIKNCDLNQMGVSGCVVIDCSL